MEYFLHTYMFDINNTNYSFKDIQVSRKQIKPKQMSLFYKPSPYYKAKEFGNKFNITTSFVLKLFRQYGMNKVLALTSFLTDYPINEKGYIGLIIWKLKK